MNAHISALECRAHRIVSRMPTTRPLPHSWLGSRLLQRAEPCLVQARRRQDGLVVDFGRFAMIGQRLQCRIKTAGFERLLLRLDDAMGLRPS
jgi:hypothetical protein